MTRNIEKYEKLNLTDINYAIEVKEEFDVSSCTDFETSTTTVWVEMPEENSEIREEVKFLPGSLARAISVA